MIMSLAMMRSKGSVLSWMSWKMVAPKGCDPIP